MIGYKTSGDWSDVTSLNRNEIVFEGRNKEYGAYALRKQYNNSLILALLIASSIGVLCAGIPFIINILNPLKPGIKLPGDSKPKWVDIKIDTHVDIPKVIIPPKPPHVTPPDPSLIIPVRITTIDSVSNIPTTPTDPKGGSGTPGSGNHSDSGTGTNEIHVIVPPKPIEIPTIVQVMPEFPGLEKFIRDNVRYPDFEKSQGIEGTVFLTFVVSEDGSISDIKILRGVSGGPGYDEAAVDVVKAMPKWNPGMQDGHKVKVRINLPIHFSLD